MNRPDLSSDLIHWTRGASAETAFINLLHIVEEQRLLGASELRKGNYFTVCFTETPRDHFHDYQSRYSPFGVGVSKQWAFAKGARPVVYQRDTEFTELAESSRWRHVRYEPDGNPPIDFTWEREWRIPAVELSLGDSGFTVIVPHVSYRDAILKRHEDREQYRIWWDGEVYGDEWAYQQPDPFPHRIEILPA